jgi:AraC-like DNA-binding protein
MNNILIIDGNPEVRNITIKSLQEAGFEVIVRENLSSDTRLLESIRSENVENKKRIASLKSCQQNELSTKITVELKICSIQDKLASNLQASDIENIPSIFPVSNCSKLNKIFEFIEEHYRERLFVYDVAQALGYNTAYLTNLVKRKTKKGIYAWIIERRMSEACKLLLKTDQSVNNIASEVGYPDASHFTRHFRQIYSISPKAWRDAHVLLIAA